MEGVRRNGIFSPSPAGYTLKHAMRARIAPPLRKDGLEAGRMLPASWSSVLKSNRDKIISPRPSFGRGKMILSRLLLKGWTSRACFLVALSQNQSCLR